MGHVTILKAIMRPFEFTSEVGPAVVQLGDEVIMVQVSDKIDFDILRWNYGNAQPEKVDTLADDRIGAIGVVTSERFFPMCKREGALLF